MPFRTTRDTPEGSPMPIPYQRKTLWDRYSRQMGSWAKPLLTMALIAVGGGVVRIVKAVLATPNQVKTLTVRVDTVAARQERQTNELKDVSEATWTFVGLRCLEMSDSAIVDSKLACGKAFRISGITRRLSR